MIEWTQDDRVKLRSTISGGIGKRLLLYLWQDLPKIELKADSYALAAAEKEGMMKLLKKIDELATPVEDPGFEARHVDMSQDFPR